MEAREMNTFVEQVGGTHYAASYMHWDWAAETALGYLESAATKYVSRWRQKGGAQDLGKAASYLVKLQKVAALIPGLVPAGERELADDDRLRRFFDSADIPATEAHIISLVDGWTRENEWLEEAISLITVMAEDARTPRPDPTGQAEPFGYQGDSE